MNSKTKLIIAAAVVLLAVATVLIASVLTNGDEAQASAPVVQASAPADDGQAASKSGLAAYDTDGDGIVYQDGMHPHIVQDEPGTCPICGMDLMPVSVDGQEEGTVKIDPVTMQNMGVRTARAEMTPLGRNVRTTGRFEADERLQTVVSPKVSGWVEELHVDYTGARVKKGQPLLEIYSPELVSTQEEYLLALRNAERLQGNADAQRLVEAARRRLAYWDITGEQIARLEETGEPTKTLTLYAPASGTVTATQVTEGQKIMAGQTLMHLADLSRLWLMVDVYEQDLAWVGVGTAAEVDLPYDPGYTLAGRVGYVYDELNADLRAVKARIEVPNPGLKLKPGMYATVQLTGREAAPAPVVPSEAIITSGKKEVVVLALGDGRFKPVEVRTGLQSDGRVQVLEGLRGSEEVVTSAQFLIDSEARLQSAVSAMAGHNHGGSAPKSEQAEQPAETDAHAGMDMKADAAAASPSSHAGMDMKAETKSAAKPAATSGGVQTVEIAIDGAAFEPASIELKAGVPTRLVFTRHTDRTCATAVQIPELGVEATDLPLGEAVTIEVTPKKAGTFTFACGMDMVKGTLLVTS